MEKTLFAKIIDREITADIIYEDDQCLAFHDINPQAPTHVLLVPKHPIDKLISVSEQDRPLLGYLLERVPVLAKQLGIEEAFRVVINNGSGAGQTVFHLHLHLLGGRVMHWPPG
jgi:histidine triad (HIT) family protein